MKSCKKFLQLFLNLNSCSHSVTNDIDNLLPRLLAISTQIMDCLVLSMTLSQAIRRDYFTDLIVINCQLSFIRDERLNNM